MLHFYIFLKKEVIFIAENIGQRCDVVDGGWNTYLMKFSAEQITVDKTYDCEGRYMNSLRHSIIILLIIMGIRFMMWYLKKYGIDNQNSTI